MTSWDVHLCCRGKDDQLTNQLHITNQPQIFMQSLCILIALTHLFPLKLRSNVRRGALTPALSHLRPAARQSWWNGDRRLSENVSGDVRTQSFTGSPLFLFNFFWFRCTLSEVVEAVKALDSPPIPYHSGMGPVFLWKPWIKPPLAPLSRKLYVKSSCSSTCLRPHRVLSAPSLQIVSLKTGSFMHP